MEEFLGFDLSPHKAGSFMEVVFESMAAVGLDEDFINWTRILVEESIDGRDAAYDWYQASNQVGRDSFLAEIKGMLLDRNLVNPPAKSLFRRFEEFVILAELVGPGGSIFVFDEDVEMLREINELLKSNQTSLVACNALRIAKEEIVAQIRQEEDSRGI